MRVANFIAVLISSALIACGGGSGGGAPGASSASLISNPSSVNHSSSANNFSSLATSSVSIVTLEQRVTAVNTTVADNSICKSIDIFYWQFGDKTGALAAGWGGRNAPQNPQAETAEGIGPDVPMGVASASKWVFGAYAMQRDGYAVLSGGSVDIGGRSIARRLFLNFTSGYDQEETPLCLKHTVADCFTGSIANYNPASANKFSYNGGHMQAYAVNLGLGEYRDDDGLLNGIFLADEIRRITNRFSTLTYDFPSLAGGANMSPNTYAEFLRAMLNQDLELGRYLGADPVCAWVDPAITNKTCDAIATPISGSSGDINYSAEHWHYSYGHWVEDDPVVGDGAFSSPGAFGFYPWISADKSFYGIVARQETVIGRPALESVGCGRLLRKAWGSGIAQM
jgi:hypothetical protein